MTQSQRGFTLLELMLVLVIIAASSGIVMLSYGQSESSQKTATRTAEQLNSMMAFGVDKAGFEGRPLGMLLSVNGWQIMQPVRDKKGKWRWAPLAGDHRLAMAGQWDPAIEIKTEPFDLKESGTPQIILLPDGQITPFSLRFSSQETRQQLAMLTSAGAFPLHQEPAGEVRP
jgi:general secretion pathway protein H